MTETDYDRVDYGGNAQFFTAPNLIAGLGRALGMPCALPGTARVLELGCGNAANLIPLASFWPQAQFVGYDLAQTPIDQGRARIAALGLRNLRLEQGDVTRLEPADVGQFDYVIVHGLYSWVPDFVREAVLRLVAGVLAPMGIGYISYNAYPGCRLRHVVRELMQFHLGDQAYSLDAAQSAWSMLGSVGKVPKEERPPFFLTLEEEVAAAMTSGVNYLFHDDLAPNNQPFHLYEFAQRAADAGLTYLGDADPDCMFEGSGAPGLTDWLDSQSAGDWMRRHQYLDFAQGTRFRRSLICRAQDGIKPAFSTAHLDSLRFVTEYRADGPNNPNDRSVTRFVSGTGRVISSDTPAIKLVLGLLESSPTASLGVAQLAERFSGTARATAMSGARGVLGHMLQNGLAYVGAEDPPGCLSVDTEGDLAPRLSALSRESLGLGRVLADNLNRGFQLSAPWIAQWLLEFDGTRSVAELTVRARELSGAKPGDDLPPELSDGVEGLIQSYARRGLLAG